MSPAQRTRELILNINVKLGGLGGMSWCHPDNDPRYMVTPAYAAYIAERAEKAAIHALFRADHLAYSKISSGRAVPNYYEPISFFGYIAARTNHIGLIATASTTFTEPFNLARQFASLDHLSSGRVAWNIVTSALAGVEANFNHAEPIAHSERYKIAHEFLEVVTRLWDCWQDDAVVADVSRRMFIDVNRVHAINHTGAYYKVQGPLNIPRTPQGRPVLVQAGSSSAGRDFAAHWADATYTISETLEAAHAYRKDMDTRLEAAKRHHGAIRVLQGLNTIIAPTRAEAREKHDQLLEFVDAGGIQRGLHHLFGIDFQQFDLDAPVPDLPPAESVHCYQSIYQMFLDMLEREKPATLRDALHSWEGRGGGPIVVGSASDVADFMEEWFRSGAIDGFNLGPLITQGGIEGILELLVPELQRRGLFRTSYAGLTLRENLGLAS